MDDLISRSEAIRVASGYCHWSNIPKELEKLPSVSTEKTGHWYLYEMFANGEAILECSVCHNKHDKPWNYCPSCGTKMVEQQERSGEE